MGIACIFRHTKSVIFIVFILNCLIIFSNVVLARVTSNTDGWYGSGSLPFLNRQKRQTIANCSSLVRTNGSCWIPSNENGRRIQVQCSGSVHDQDPLYRAASGMYVRRLTLLSLNCESGYILNDDDYQQSICYNEEWVPPLPSCSKLCPKLTVQDGMKLECSYKGAKIDCDGAIRPTVKVYPECRYSYLKAEDNLTYEYITCKSNGEWDAKLFTCIPDCGRPYTPTQTLIAGGKTADISDSPWNVGIYDHHRNDILICGGTIISPHLIISAAHCFYNESNKSKNSVDNYEIVVAKFTRNKNVVDNPYQKFYKLKNIYIHKNYVGSISYHANNIAILETFIPMRFSALVLPACINWATGHAQNDLVAGVPGKVVGWGLDSSGKLSDVLNVGILPYIPYKQCIQNMPFQYRAFIIVGTFCAGEEEFGPSLRQGDSGAGLLFRRNDDRYYLYGLVSSRLANLNTSLFTDIYDHIEWISGIRNAIEKRGISDVDTINNPKTVSISKTPPVTAIESSIYKQAVPLSVDESKTCHVPPVSPGRTCSINCRGAISDCSIPGAHLRLSCTCDRNYTLSSTKINEAYCADGIWFPTVPECLPLCPILKSTMLNFVSCSNGSSSVSCTEPAKPGTIVRIECKPNYVPVEPSSVVRSVVCGYDGMWDSPLYKCRPECGLPYPGTVPLISEGRPAKPHEAPWHVAVYLKVNSNAEVRYRYICGGTIISPFLIVSAAHCFTDAATNEKLPVENFKIAVAKMTVQYNISDDPETRIFDVAKLYIPDNYYGEDGSYASDIALVELDGIMKMSNKVMPICIDWSPPANSKPPDIGTIAGWGSTNNETTSDVLLMAQLSFIPHNKCRQMVQPTFVRFISIADKFCSGSLSGPGARPGDSGGGWMYERNGHYFVYGIVSFKDKSSTSSVATFTRIPFHLDWMEGIKREVERRRGH